MLEHNLINIDKNLNRKRSMLKNLKSIQQHAKSIKYKNEIIRKVNTNEFKNSGKSQKET